MKEVFSKHFLSATTGLLMAAYALGFIFWNFYLSTFGYFEYDVVQVRYLSTGILFILPLVALSFLWYSVSGMKSRLGIYTKVIVIFFVLIWVVNFPNIFFHMPQYLGGARPIPTTIIGTSEQIKFLENFGISGAQNAGDEPSVQTYPVCLIYQNDNYALFSSVGTISTTSNGIGFSPRVLSIARDQFIGFQTLVGYDNQCGLSEALYDGTATYVPAGGNL